MVESVHNYASDDTDMGDSLVVQLRLGGAFRVVLIYDRIGKLQLLGGN
jgi:hypothetical protein